MFILDGDRYLPTDRARGPWNREFLHGGPVAGLLAHALNAERSGPDMLMARMTIDLMQAVPVAPLSIETRVVRENRRTRYIEATLSGNGAIVAHATAMMLRRSGNDDGASTLPHCAPLPSWQALPPGTWGRHTSLALFHNGVDVREIRRPFAGQPMAVWAHVPYELLPGRGLSAVEHAATLSDFANGIGIMSQSGPETFFINGDITLYLHREPKSAWIALEGVGRGDCAGIATSNVNLHDEAGLFGHVSLACVANRLSPSPGYRSAEATDP